MKNYFCNKFDKFESYLSSKKHKQWFYKKGEPIKDIGEPINDMYYIRNGIITAFVIHESGHIKAFSFYGKGYIAPLYFPGYSDSFQTLSFAAFTDVELYVYNKNEFCACLNENNELNIAMYEAYIELVGYLIDENINQMYSTGMQKICNFFCMYLESKEGKDMMIDLSQKEIMEYVGLNHANLAKYLKKLRENGIIETHRNKLRITDPNQLLSLCSFE